MSLVNYYKCDVCDKQAKKTYLMNFKRTRYIFNSSILHYDKEIYDKEIKEFDICPKCFARIVMEIKKEYAE